DVLAGKVLAELCPMVNREGGKGNRLALLISPPLRGGGDAGRRGGGGFASPWRMCDSIVQRSRFGLKFAFWCRRRVCLPSRSAGGTPAPQPNPHFTVPAARIPLPRRRDG